MESILVIYKKVYNKKYQINGKKVMWIEDK